MKFGIKYSNNKFSKEEIAQIMEYSSAENAKYLNDIIALYGITLFDALYIMQHLRLDKSRIELIKFAIERYKNNSEFNDFQSSMFIYDLVRNIEKLENGNLKLLEEIKKCRTQITNFKEFVEGSSYIIYPYTYNR